MAFEIHKIGKFGEDFAVKCLKRKGYKILERNFHSRFGEIDVIASNKKVIAFVEVKTRNEVSLYTPREAVDKFKMQKCIKTAQYYLVQNPTNLQPRFDVFEIVVNTDGKKPKVSDNTYIENAF